MHILSRLTGGTAAAALLLSAACPAVAGDGRWDGPRRHHDHDRGPSAGAVIGALAAVGIVAAIASSASKKKDAEKRATEDRARSDEGARYDGRDSASRYDDVRAEQRDQEAAVDACAVAARSQAGGSGDYAEIKGVNDVSAWGSGWTVSGRVEQRSGYSASDSWQRMFRCNWRDGRVSSVALD